MGEKMGLFSRVWGKGYNDRVSLFLMANAVCVSIIIPKMFPIPFLGKVSLAYLSITFLLVNRRFKLITLGLFELHGMASLTFSGARFYVMIPTALDAVFTVIGFKDIVDVLQYQYVLRAGTDILMRAFFISTFIGYTLAIGIVFLLMSLIIDWKFKIRKRAGLI